MPKRKRNPNGAGSIYLRKDGRYEAAAYVTTTTGERKRVRVYGKTWDEAHEELVKLLGNERQGIPVPDKSWKVGEYLDYWLEHVARPGVRRTTYAKYESFVRLDLKPGLGKKRLDKLTPADVTTFLAQRRRAGDSEHQLQAMHSILRNALQHAVRMDLVHRNAAELVKAPRPGRRKFRPWTVKEALAFLASARDHSLFAAFLMILMLGLRKGEVLGLAWEDLDLDAGILDLGWQLQRDENRQLVRVAVKTDDSEQVMPLPQVVVWALGRRKAMQAADRLAAGERWHDTGLVFTTRYGTAIQPRNFNRTFDTFCAKANVRRIRVHDTRHTCASLLAAMKVHPRTIMKILRHSQIAVTMNVYTHVYDEDVKEAMRVMDELFGRLPAEGTA
ncbi:site-specific integrase [Carbonactinospora thermoautotrophica]|uniref:site-specific integrase n=1 Tax=Carbonactinospora thermoautotrophica TaxID=1469144 RepID=UPI002270D314|nr:site-specific integrase [Carbonactinospora thermoautotrophica]MCX9192002.1 site-specific integrase [Carbonactinospora thermoautotrophica]